MFPEDLHLQTDQRSKGKVFSAVMHRAGGMLRIGERIHADIAEWDDCQQCPEFESCSSCVSTETEIRHGSTVLIRVPAGSVSESRQRDRCLQGTWIR